MTNQAKVRGRMAELDRNAAWLARWLGVYRSTVSRWLSQGVPDHRRREVALALGKPADWLEPVAA